MRIATAIQTTRYSAMTRQVISTSPQRCMRSRLFFLSMPAECQPVRVDTAWAQDPDRSTLSPGRRPDSAAHYIYRVHPAHAIRLSPDRAAPLVLLEAQLPDKRSAHMDTICRRERDVSFDSSCSQAAARSAHEYCVSHAHLLELIDPHILGGWRIAKINRSTDMYI